MPTLNFIQVTGLFLWQQVGVGIFSGIDFVHEQGTEPAFVAALWKPPTQKQDERSFTKAWSNNIKTEKFTDLRKTILKGTWRYGLKDYHANILWYDKHAYCMSEWPAWVFRFKIILTPSEKNETWFTFRSTVKIEQATICKNDCLSKPDSL